MSTLEGVNFEGCTQLTSLEISYCNELYDISALNGLFVKAEKLKKLRLDAYTLSDSKAQ